MASLIIYADENAANQVNGDVATPSDGGAFKLETPKSSASLTTVDLNSIEPPKSVFSLSSLASPIQTDSHIGRLELFVESSGLSITPEGDISNLCYDSAADSQYQQNDECPQSPIAETDEERVARELAESEALAFELMQQESQEAYRIQMEFIRENADNISSEDYAVMQRLISETEGQQQASGEHDESENAEEDEADERDQSDPDGWDYERLLALGNIIGDVKTDRWRTRAQTVIASLNRISFGELSASHAASESVSGGAATEIPGGEAIGSETVSAVPALPCKRIRVQDYRCNICMGDFEATEQLCVLPCEHYFHDNCTEQWLADHNSCPICKTRVAVTP